MSIEYFLFIFVSSLAVIQAASTWQNLKFLLFLRNRLLTFILAMLAIIASYYWFFYLGGKQVRDTGGNKQLFLFPLAVLASTALTIILSSLINAGRRPALERGVRREELESKSPVSEQGIEVLREKTYWQAVRQTRRKI